MYTQYMFVPIIIYMHALYIHCSYLECIIIIAAAMDVRQKVNDRVISMCLHWNYRKQKNSRTHMYTSQSNCCAN